MRNRNSVIAALLLCALLLAACGGESEKTEETAGTQPSETAEAIVQTDPTEDASYTVALDASIPIFDAPSYDGLYVCAVGEDGVFTVVEEKTDSEGNVWGRLKSGIGWVDLTYVHAFYEDPPLITVSYADNALSGMADYDLHIVEDTEYTQKLIFRAGETLYDVEFLSLALGETSYVTDTVLYVQETLTPEKPFVLGIVFYGDMTAYGISFKDREGQIYRYAVSVSGRNGMLVVQPF